MTKNTKTPSKSDARKAEKVVREAQKAERAALTAKRDDYRKALVGKIVRVEGGKKFATGTMVECYHVSINTWGQLAATVYTVGQNLSERPTFVHPKFLSADKAKAIPANRLAAHKAALEALKANDDGDKDVLLPVRALGVIGDGTRISYAGWVGPVLIPTSQFREFDEGEVKIDLDDDRQMVKLPLWLIRRKVGNDAAAAIMERQDEFAALIA